MRIRKLACIVCTSLLAVVAYSSSPLVATQQKRTNSGRHVGSLSGAVLSEPSLPVRLELTPINQPEVGQPARFRVNVQTDLGPGLVRGSRLEYQVPRGVRIDTGTPAAMDSVARTGRGQAEFAIVVPDEKRYEIRARLILQLANGESVAQTAVRWIDLGEEDPPDGMIGRIVDRNGNGIRLYRGERVRN